MADPTPVSFISHAIADVDTMSAQTRPIASLPIPLTSLLGRDGDVDRILTLLDSGDTRLLTLLGPGGVGKTRLAVEVARRIAPDFADGAVFVALESIRDASLVPSAVARTFGLQDRPGQAAGDVLVDLVADRHLLLVLDNVEQVIGAGTWLSRLLTRCPRITTLATSRTPLKVGGEHRFFVAPLPVPNDDNQRSPAVDLFVERARAANLDVELDDTALAAVTTVCRRLDGLPLAIELAAARVSVLSPQALLARLTHRLTLLTGGRCDVPVRLRSMREAIAWSHDLLSSDEQRVFQRLSAFLGGFSLEAAAHVAAWPAPPLADEAAIGLVESLVDQNLIQTVTNTVEPRFRMLETIREFGLDDAADSGETDTTGRAHAEYHLRLAERAEPTLLGPDQAIWLDRLDTELPNIRAAIAWLEGHERLGDAIMLTSRLYFFLTLRGHSEEALGRVEGWLKHPANVVGGHARGLVLLILGGLLQNTGDFRRSASGLAEAVGLLHRAGDRWHEAMARSILAATYAMVDDVERMRKWAESAIAVAGPVGQHRVVSINLGFLADYARRTGDEQRALQLKEESSRSVTENGDIWLQTFLVRDLTARALAAGDLTEAEKHAEEAMRLLESLGAKRDLPFAWVHLASIARARGDLDAAAERIDSGLAVAETFGYHASATLLTLLRGILDVERGDLRAAKEAFTIVLGRFDPELEHGAIAGCLDSWALLATRAGDRVQARRFHRASVELLREAGLDAGPPSSHQANVWVSEALRTALGEQALARFEDEGTPVTVDVAIAEAMSYTLPLAVAPADDVPPFGLSPRELELLRLIASGHSNQQIADALFISLRTVTTHVTHILTKLNVSSRTAAVSCAIRNGFAL